MPGSKMVVLVPDAQVRESVRSLASSHPIDGLQASIYVADELVDACVRDTRRGLFDGPLAVLTRDEPSSLRALAAGADEAWSLASLTLDEAAWRRLVARARVKSEARRESGERLAAVSELEKLCALGRLAAGAVARDLGLSDGGHERHEWLDVRALLERVLGLFQRAAGKPTWIERDYAGEIPELFVPRARLAQVLTSLCSHALSNRRALIQGSRERVSARSHGELHRLRIGLCADAAVVTLTVSDHGPALAPEVLARIFDPCATGAPIRLGPHGLGLELAVARSTMRALGGDLTVESLRDEGTTFVAWLPRSSRHRAPRYEVEARTPSRERCAPELGSRPMHLPYAPAAPASEGPSRCVLVFEPDRHVLGALAKLLGERYQVLTAQRGEQARVLIAKGAPPDAIVAASDDREGHEFVEWLLLERPDLSRRLLLTTGHAEPSERLHGLPWLEKPLDPAALQRELEERCASPLRKTRPNAPPRDPSREAGRAREAPPARSPRPEAC